MCERAVFDVIVVHVHMEGPSLRFIISFLNPGLIK